MTRKSRRFVRALVAGVFFYTAGDTVSVCKAQITPSGLGTVVNQPSAGVFNITAGTRPGGGTNLFHSFGDFSLNTSESANFLNDSGLPTTNILSRVTGGNPSRIFGTINTMDFPGANLFLMNPAGIIFGPTAQLNVGGSFHATTADYIKLGNDGRFYADPLKPTTLSVAPPSAFGFLTSNPGPIDVNTSNPGPIFSVPFGETLSFVGGPVHIGAADFSAPGYVMAPGGTLNLVSVSSPGEATFNGPVPVNVEGFTRLGDINIRGGSIVDAKNVFIRGGKLAIDEAVILPGAFSLFGLGPPPDGGEVNIKVRGDVNITGTAPEPFTNAPPGILTFAGSFVSPSSFPPAKVPDITIEAGSVNLSGFASVQTNRFGPGDPPAVNIKADSIRVENGAAIALFNQYEGPGGTLTVEGGQVELAGVGSPGGAVGATGLLAQGLFHPGYGAEIQSGVFDFDPALTRGDSGTITVRATGPNGLVVRDGAQITTDSLNFGSSGDINISSTNATFSGLGQVSAQSAFAGNSGNVKIQANGKIDIKDGFVIAANTFGSGESGNVDVSATGTITISGQASGIASQTGSPPTVTLDSFATHFLGPGATFADLVVALGLDPSTATLFDVIAGLNALGLTNVTDVTAGNAGRITVTTPLLTVTGHNSAIDSGTAWDGNAGNVQVNAGSVVVSGGAEIRSRSGILNLETGNLDIGTGNAGEVRITATDGISVTDTGSAISTSTLGNGNAGDILLSANQVEIQNGGSITSASGGVVNGQSFVGTGNAGIVNMTGTDISVSGTRSTVSTSTLGNGNGGDVSLTAGRSVNIVNGALVSADSLGGRGLAGAITIAAGDRIAMDQGSVSTRAVTADGGNITLNAPNLIQLTDSQVTTSVESGVGGGGNITIDPQALILNNSRILANAFGGPGGNINITADVFLVNNNGAFPTSLTGIVDASSALSTPGTINIEANFTNVEGSVTLLPETPLKATELLRAACAARFAGGKTSSLVVGGRDGLPPQPGDLLPSPLFIASDAATPSTTTRISGYDQFSHLSLLGPRDRRLDRYSLLPNSKCS